MPVTPVTKAVSAARRRNVAPTGPLSTASWRTSWLTVADLLARLADLCDSTPVQADDGLVTDATYDGTVHLHTRHTAPPMGGPHDIRSIPLLVGELRALLAGWPDFAPVTVDGDALSDTGYTGELHLHTTWPDDEDQDEDDGWED